MIQAAHNSPGRDDRDERGAAPSVLRAPGLVLRLDAAGTVVSAGPDAGPGAAETAWLVQAGPLAAATSEGLLPLGPARVRVDADEVEVERDGGGLRTLVRHSVGAAWTVRVVLANETDTELALAEVRLGWRAAPGTVVSGLAAGAAAAYAVETLRPGGPDGPGPVLVGRLRSGLQTGVDATGLLLGPLVLGPRHRWAVQWRWTVEPDARRAGAGDLPRTTWLDLGQPVVLPGGPDVAVVAPGLAVELDEDRVELAAPEPGTYRVELRAARGTTACTLDWAPDLDDLVDAAAEGLLAGSTTPAGTVRLPGAAAGLVVQDALARRSVGDPDELADALELAAGEVVERLDDPPAGADPLGLAFLAREADRTGSAALLAAARTGLLALRAAAPGVGLAGFALVLAHVRADAPTAAVTAHLASLVAGAPDDAGLEIALLLRPRDAGPGAAVLDGLRRLGAGLGAGLPGRVLPAVPLARLAYASTLLGLVDERTGAQLRRRWGVGAADVARRAAAEARAGAAADPYAPAARTALAWLVLGRRPV